MRKKFGLVVLLAILSLLLTGCAFLNKGGENEMDYPVGIITPKPTLDLDADETDDEAVDETDEEEPTPTEMASETPTPIASATPITAPTDDEDEDNDLPNVPVGENKIIVSSVTATETDGGISAHIEGKYPDACTTGRYSWSISGTQIIIDLGQKDESITECGASDRAYSGDVALTYSFDADTEYTVVVNGVESDPITIE